jgi:3-oxoacyl-[acyl-carrier protein] reductase
MARTAIITGASRGIGKAIAIDLVRHGLQVVINYAGRASEADSVVEEIKKLGGEAIAIQADISQTSDCTRLFDEAQRVYGPIDVLVNNAGVILYKTIVETEDEEFDRLMAVNVRGTFNTLRLAATKLNYGGRIVNFSSSVVGLSLPTYATYSASKAAVESMTRVFSKELRGKNITVNAVAPGPTGTDLFLQGKTTESIDHFAKMNPLERLGTPEDIAHVVTFLVSEQGGWINGQIVRANGGMV